MPILPDCPYFPSFPTADINICKIKIRGESHMHGMYIKRPFFLPRNRTEFVTTFTLSHLVFL
jgi:hypothetical protein